MRPESPKAWWTVTLGLALVRLWLAVWVPLGDDEGYYWIWSRHLATSYYDHPPLVAWLVALSTRVLGDSLLALRLPFVVCGTLSALALNALIAETTGDERLARRASMVFQLVPVFVALGFMVLPDGPLVLFWLLAGRAARRLERRPGRAAALLLGLALGGAALSKYVAALLAVSLAVVLLRSAAPDRVRALLVSLVIALLLTTPVLWWNAHHAWASFDYQLVTRHRGWHFDPARPLLYVGSQALYLGPPLLVLILAAVLRMGPWRWEGSGERLLWWLGAPTACGFLGVAGFTSFKPNWAAPGYATLIALAFRGLARWGESAPHLARRVGLATLAMAVAFTAVPIAHLAHPLLPIPPRLDPTVDMAGWPEIARRAEAAADRLRAEGQVPFFAAGRYALASRLEFYLPVHPEVVCLDPGRDAYDDWQDLERLRGRAAVFIASDRYPARPEQLFACDSARVEARMVVAGRADERFAVTLYDVRGYRPDRR